MNEKPKYCIGDLVKFKMKDVEMEGTVYIVDPYGTFEQNEEPSYDVMLQEKHGLCKHIRESEIIGKLKEE